MTSPEEMFRRIQVLISITALVHMSQGRCCADSSGRTLPLITRPADYSPLEAFRPSTHRRRALFPAQPKALSNDSDSCSSEEDQPEDHPVGMSKVVIFTLHQKLAQWG